MNYNEFLEVLKKHDKWTRGKADERQILVFEQIDGESNTIENLNLSEFEFTGTTLENITFKNVSFRDVYFINAKLKNVTFINCTFDESDFSNAEIKNSTLVSTVHVATKHAYVNFSAATFEGSRIVSIFLERVNFSGAILIDTDLTNIVISGEAKNCYAERCRFTGVDFYGTNLYQSRFSKSVFERVLFESADLSNTDFSDSIFDDCNLNGAKIDTANFSGVTGLPSAIDCIEDNFETTNEGIIAYKTFSCYYLPPNSWKIEKGSIIRENVNTSRTQRCGCGVNVGTAQWVYEHCFADDKDVQSTGCWKVLIKWEWLAGVCVPYDFDGKMRCERVQLLEELSYAQLKQIVDGKMKEN